MPSKLTQKEHARRAFARAVKKAVRARHFAWEAWTAMRNAKAHVEGIQFCSDAARIGEFLKKEMETLSEMAKQNNVGACTLQSQASNLAEMLGLKERCGDEDGVQRDAAASPRGEAGMSYSTAYLVMNDGRILEEAEYRNGHGAGPRVWSPMARRFFPGARGYYDILGRGPQEAEQERRFWDLYKNPTVPRAWRAAMLFTFDYAVIERERFMEVAALLEQFSAESERFLEHSHVNHLPAIAVLLRANAGREDVRGACFQQTSVSEDLWFRYDEEKDESLPRDVNGPDICWVGALLDQYDPKQEGAAP